MLTLEALRNVVASVPTEEVAIAGLPSPARFRSIPGAQRARLTAFFHEAGEAAQARIWEYKLLVIALSLCNEAGERVVPDDQIQPVLGALPGEIVDDLFMAAARVSKLVQGAAEDAGKNSEAGQN